MGLLSLPAPRLTILSSSSLPSSSSSSSRKFVIDRHSFLSGQVISVSSSKRFSDARNLKFIGFKTKALESARASSRSSQVTEEATKQESQLKDEDLVFVAGATGRVGSRTVRELLKLGFRVRAGVRSSSRAGALLQSVQQKKLDDGATVVEKLEIVECDLERDSIAPAIGNASVVICCIGASEKEVFDITGPYRIDYKATKNLVDAATVAGVNHFILLTSLGTNKIGFPAAILNLFWGVLIWKRKAEEALIESGLPYTIVRPGGMERPTDAYKETHNIVLTKEDTLFGGQVSNLQVAELMAFMARNLGLSHCKVVEVIAETTAPLTPMGELLATIPSQRLDLTEPEEPQSVDKLDPLPSEKINFEAKSSLVKEKPMEKEVEITTPLSPYVAYYDLKPPASPTPTLPRSTKEHASVVQPGLKVTTQVDIPIPTTVVADEKSVPVEALGSMPLSPYPVYDDLKPPSSPSPSPPNAGPAPSIFASGVESESSATTDTVNRVAKPLTSDKQHSGELKPSPLSPFTMYYDLKPPSSPMPSSPTKC